MCMFVESGGQTNQNFIMNLSSPYVFYSIKHKVVFKQSIFFLVQNPGLNFMFSQYYYKCYSLYCIV